MVVWDREDYLKKAHEQLENRQVYKEVLSNPIILVNTIRKALEKNILHGDLFSDTLNYSSLSTQKSLGSTFYLKFISV